MEQQKCEGHEKQDWPVISKVNFNFQISQRNKTFTFWPSFLELT